MLWLLVITLGMTVPSKRSVTGVVSEGRRGVRGGGDRVETDRQTEREKGDRERKRARETELNSRCNHHLPFPERDRDRERERDRRTDRQTDVT